MINKKGDLAISTVAKLLITVTVLVIILLIIYAMNDKSLSLFDKIKDSLRFGA